MIKFQHLVNILLEAEDSNKHWVKPSEAGLTGKHFEPMGHSSSSVISKIGFENGERRQTWDHDSSQMTDEQKKEYAAAFKAQQKFFNAMGVIFRTINQKPETKQHVESIISNYMDLYNRIMGMRTQISRLSNQGDEKEIWIPPNADVEESEGRIFRPRDKKGKPLPSNFVVLSRQCEVLMDRLHRMDAPVWDAIVDYAVEVVAPVMHVDEVARLKALKARNPDEEIPEPRSVEYFDSSIRNILNKWKQLKEQNLEKSREKMLLTKAYYGFTTPVSSIANWLNNTASRLSADQQRAADNVVQYNSSRSVVGKITNIPEGTKVKRLLDIVDEVAHGFIRDTGKTSRYSKPKTVVDKDGKTVEVKDKSLFKNSEEFDTLRDEANHIVSDLAVLLGSGQFTLFQLLNSFFSDDEGSEAALKRFLIQDVVNLFNS